MNHLNVCKSFVYFLRIFRCLAGIPPKSLSESFHCTVKFFFLSTGLQTSEDARFYALSTKFPPFSTEGKDLVVQFTVKHEQNIDCGGGYVKVFDCSLKEEDLHGETPYRLMFGPDICGPGTKKVHVILNHKDKNHLINKDIRCKVSLNFYFSDNRGNDLFFRMTNTPTPTL